MENLADWNSCDTGGPDRPDFSWLLDERFPCVAAPGKNVVVGLEMRLASQLSSMSFHTFYCGLRSGLVVDSRTMAMSGGTLSAVRDANKRRG